jgi:excisionase family DNA binding protein
MIAWKDIRNRKRFDRAFVIGLADKFLIDFHRLEATFYGSISEISTIMNTEPWVSVDQVAQHLGVAKDTVYRWRERKGLPAHRIGRLWKFKLSEVDDWVRAGCAAEEQTED